MDYISARTYPILLCISYLCGYGKKSYAYPSQSTLIKLLKSHYKIDISRRTLCRWLGSLEESGYIRRIRRIRRGLGGRPEYTSTLYLLQAKAHKLLGKLSKSLFALKDKAQKFWIKIKAPIHQGLTLTRGTISPTSDAWAIKAAQHALEAEAKAKARMAAKLEGLDLSDPIQAMLRLLQ